MKTTVERNKKILVISTVGLIYDGITNVILSNLQEMDKTGLTIYIASTIKAEPNIIKQFAAMGGRIIELPDRRKTPLKYFLALVKCIRKNGIDVMHANGNSATLAIEMLAGKLGGCKKRIAHSHNTQCEQVKADKLLRPLFYFLYTDAVACGDSAGKWLFRKRPYTIINNGRKLQAYSYAPDKRAEMREELHIGSSIAVGHVGGFVPQKNHVFLLQIYKELMKLEADIKLFVFGDGYLRKEIEEKARQEGIFDNIFFAGNTDRMADYLQAMDIMALPSLFEGLPLVAIEWQVAGLPFVVSDRVSQECKIVDTVMFKALQDGEESWAKEILHMKKYMGQRKEKSLLAVENARKKGFDISDSAESLRSLYLGKMGGCVEEGIK